MVLLRLLLLLVRTAAEASSNFSAELETQSSLTLPRAPPPPPSCPVVGGVCDASRCADGFSAVDSTLALGTAFASGAHTVLVRNMGTPWLVTSRLSLALANQTVLLEAGAVIEAKRFAPFWNNSGSMKPITNPLPLLQTAQAGSTNVSIVGLGPGAALRMQKQDYMDYSKYPLHNEWRHGIYISGSTDISVTDIAIENTGGDGICISWESQRVHIARVHVNSSYRNALTITNGRDVLVEDSSFSNTFGTPPEAGCDIEPDWPYTWLKNITFKNSTFAGNEGPGFSLAPSALKAYNRSQFPNKGCAEMRTSDDAPACPMSIALEGCTITGRPEGVRKPCKDDNRFDCWPLTSYPGTGVGSQGEDEQYGIAVGGVRQRLSFVSVPFFAVQLYALTRLTEDRPLNLQLHHDGPRGTFRVADTVIARTALSGIMISEKASTAALMIFDNVTLIETATNRTGYSNWIYKGGWLNSPVVIQDDSPLLYGSPGGIVFAGLRVEQSVPRPWLTTDIEPSTRLLSIGGKVTVASEWPHIACGVNASKPSDIEDLVGVEIVCG